MTPTQITSRSSLAPGVYAGPLTLVEGHRSAIFVPAGMTCEVHRALDLDSRDPVAYLQLGDLATWSVEGLPFTVRVLAAYTFALDDEASEVFCCAYSGNDPWMFPSPGQPSVWATLGAHMAHARNQLQAMEVLRPAFQGAPSKRS